MRAVGEVAVSTEEDKCVAFLHSIKEEVEGRVELTGGLRIVLDF